MLVVSVLVLEGSFFCVAVCVICSNVGFAAFTVTSYRHARGRAGRCCVVKIQGSSLFHFVFLLSLW